MNAEQIKELIPKIRIAHSGWSTEAIKDFLITEKECDEKEVSEVFAEIEKNKIPTPAVNVETIPPIAVAIARKFVEMGAHVIFFPRGTKACKISGWEQLATNNIESALIWAEQDPYANVGLVGKQDGIWGLDDDAGLVSEYEKTYGPVQTYGTKTVSGGRHFIFRQNAASWAMGNISVKDEQNRELVSARINDRYVVAAGSWAYPNNDESQPLTQYTAINPDASIQEAPGSLLDFIRAKDAESKAKKSKSGEQISTVPRQVTKGGRNNYLISCGGKLRNARASYDSILAELRRINESDCVPPLPHDEVENVARSAAKYDEGTPGMILDQQPTAVVTVDEPEPEIEESQSAKRPVFPLWVLAGTSLNEGLVKPATEHSSKYPELIFVPAIQLYLNALALNVGLKNKPRAVPNMFVGVIAPYGQYFKSTCCELGHQYFNYLGLAAKHSRDIKAAEGKTIITSVGSTEGLGKAMKTINATKCLLYFDELGKVAGKIGIENSSFGEDLLTMYESGDFDNVTKDTKSSFNFEAKTYCFGWQWCTTDRAFPRHWAKLDNISSGLNDRMFFLLAPEKPREAAMYIEPDFKGSVETRRLIDKACAQKVYEYESELYASSKFRGLDARGLAAAEWFALYFAVDLGEDVISQECVDRARALADYRREVMAYLDPVEAETFQGRIQQQITRELRRNGGKIPYRTLHHDLNGHGLGSAVWLSAFNGLVTDGTIAVRAAKPGKGPGQRPKMVYLLKQEKC